MAALGSEPGCAARGRLDARLRLFFSVVEVGGVCVCVCV